MVRSMMNLTTLPLSFWDYAFESVAHILNMVPTKKVDKTPYELWFGKVPNLSYLKVWGCEALVKRDTPDKLQQRSVKCIFIEYPKETMGYYFYFPPKNKIVVARYAEFFEKNLLSQEVSGRAGELEEIQDEDTSPSEITSEIPMEVEGFKPPQEEEAPVRRSERPHRAPNRLCLNVEVEEHSLGDLNEPANYKAAMLDQESNKWLDAMNADMQSMRDNQVWRLVDLPPNGEAAFILGIKIYRDRSRRLIGLCQSAYMDKILKRYRMDNSKRGCIPMQERLDLNKTHGASTPGEVTRMQNVPYASTVGSIMYAVRCTRPDVAFAQNITSRFQQNPGKPHWTAVKTILKYLRNTKDMFLVYGGNPDSMSHRDLVAVEFSDVDVVMGGGN
ncbi:retrotransposon protein, putative, ty1-copia subclass [Tanacetum coccineum]